MTVEARAGVEHAVPSAARRWAARSDRRFAGDNGLASAHGVVAGVMLALAAITFAASGFLIGNHMGGAEVVRVGDAELSVSELRTVESVEGLVRLLRDAGIDLDALTASQPARSAEGAAVDTPDPSAAGDEREHVVTEGDSMYSIASQYLPLGASLVTFANEIAAYNDIEKVDLLLVGDVIRLPPP